MTLLATAPTVAEQSPPADVRAPGTRLSALLDKHSVRPMHAPDDSGVVAVRGTIEGAKVVAYCTDATRMGGSIGAAAADHIVAAIETAVRERCPVIGLWHSGGAKLADGVESMDGVGRMFTAITRASGRVPQISVVLGPAAGAAAYGPALTDLVVMSRAGRVFVTGPDIVRSVTGEQIDMESLGGAEAHGRKSGVVHIVVDSEQDAYLRARRVTALFAQPGHYDLSMVGPDENIRSLLPESARRAYDVHPLVRRILDSDAGVSSFEEIQSRWAANVLIGLGRLAGRSVGVIANNPLRKGGCLDSLSAEKAARFVRMCDALGIALVVIVDVPGYLPGVGQEWDGVVRRGAKLLHAFAESVVPRVTLITRKSYGGAYIAMNSRALGATAVFAWPEAEVAVMGASAAVEVLHRRELAGATDADRPALRDRLIEEHNHTSGGVRRALNMGVVDEIVEPADTRRRLAEALAQAPAGRGVHGNIPL
jgi:acetyl-CoA/propionyl-CoA carboxylase carboxyl transferase subunit